MPGSGVMRGRTAGNDNDPDNAEAGDSRESSGPQTIARAALLLRLLARHGLDGTRLSELKEMTGLPHPTIRRILLGLIEAGFIVQDPKTRRYLLGPMNFELGLGALFKTDFQRHFHPHLLQLAEKTGYRAFLVMRSGADAVCLDRVEGKKNVRGSTFEVGGRRPLGFGAGGLALLASLSDAEIKQILLINKRDIDNHGRLAVASFWRGVRLSRERGFAIARDIHTIGVCHVGVLVPPPPEGPRFAVSLTMDSSEMDVDRAAQLADAIKHEIVAATAAP